MIHWTNQLSLVVLKNSLHYFCDKKRFGLFFSETCCGGLFDCTDFKPQHKMGHTSWPLNHCYPHRANPLGGKTVMVGYFVYRGMQWQESGLDRILICFSKRDKLGLKICSSRTSLTDSVVNYDSLKLAQMAKIDKNTVI